MGLNWLIRVNDTDIVMSSMLCAIAHLNCVCVCVCAMNEKWNRLTIFHSGFFPPVVHVHVHSISLKTLA